MGWFT